MNDVLHSAEDASVNFITDAGDGGVFEARYVRREEDYFICYLSSHSGCDKACRFCHLTQTGQTTMRSATMGDYLAQAKQVLEHYKTVEASEATWVNFNFMARGEPFENDQIITDWRALRLNLRVMAEQQGLRPRFNLSTIMPAWTVSGPLSALLGLSAQATTIYYSLYSVDPAFRKRWLPKAADPHKAMMRLSQWQRDTGGDVVLHWTFIEGENDSLESIAETMDAVDKAGLSARFNLVRYNPYSERQGREPSQDVLERNFAYIAKRLGDPWSRIVPRVGFDVKASCGMFVEA